MQDNVIITDIDECDDENGDCDQTCVNEDGTYHCECLSGYLLDEDNTGCSGELMGGNNCMGVVYWGLLYAVLWVYNKMAYGNDKGKNILYL